MSLSVGIVGLPNVGKSTLFNALLKRQVALAANYPFATVEPNVGIVEVPDERLAKLAETIHKSDGVAIESIPLKPATIEFVDIAGLVAGASKGEGLGNKFLANIREVDLICHVLRAFEDEEVVLTGKMDPLEDLQTVRMELILKDLDSLEKQKSSLKKQNDKAKSLIIEKVISVLNEGKMVNAVEWQDDEKAAIYEMFLLTSKPEIFVVNVSEEQIAQVQQTSAFGLPFSKEDTLYISAKIESELASLDEEDQKMYLADLGLIRSGIEQMAQVAYQKLGFVSFLTAGIKECRAWQITHGTLAPQAAGTIHTDFAKKFIKAQVVDWQDFVSLGGWKKAREVGKVRQEGKDYLMKDGDVVEFMIGR